MLAERAIEIAIHRRNAARLARRGAVWLDDDGFRGILAAQVLLFTLTPLEAAFAPWSGLGVWSYAAAAGLVAAQVLRYWCIATLGERWSVRVVTVPGAPRIVGGPYRWLRHPNYLAVIAEAALLPAMFGAWGAAVLVLAAQSWALRTRIAREEAALARAAGVRSA